MAFAETVDLDVVDAARALVGWTVESAIGGIKTSVVLTETEAYRIDDPASHSYNGRTQRNGVMFGEAGRLYVYRSYGIHWCANIVTRPSGSAVLLRAGEPLAGLATIQTRRRRTDHLADGPGKLAQCLAITGTHNGLDLIASGPLRLMPPIGTVEVMDGVRVGINKATDRRWRFVAAKSATHQ